MVGRLSEYAGLAQVGEGAYATVYRATHAATNTTVALKRCVDRIDGSEPPSLARELELMRAVRGHECVLELLDSFVVGRRLFIVLPYEPGGSLLDLLAARPAGLTHAEAADLLRCLCAALAHLHAHRVVHRDVKPENLLVVEPAVAGAPRRAKLCDFGEAVRLVEGALRTEYVSTRWYRAPELLARSRTHGAPVDVWAAGCVAFEMLAGGSLFSAESEVAQAAQVEALLGRGGALLRSRLSGVSLRPHNRGTAPAMHEAAVAFVRACLALQPADRPRAAELCAHALLAPAEAHAAAAAAQRPQPTSEAPPSSAAGAEASRAARPVRRARAPAADAADASVGLNPFAAGAPRAPAAGAAPCQPRSCADAALPANPFAAQAGAAARRAAAGAGGLRADRAPVGCPAPDAGAPSARGAATREGSGAGGAEPSTMGCLSDHAPAGQAAPVPTQPQPAARPALPRADILPNPFAAPPAPAAVRPPAALPAAAPPPRAAVGQRAGR